MLTLTAEEQGWLDQYLTRLSTDFPGVVKRFIIHGSKARGDSHDDSDIDIVMIVDEADEQLSEEIRDIGHDLAGFTDTLPSMIVHSEKQWQWALENGFPFNENVEREGVDLMGAASTRKPDGTRRMERREPVLSEWRRARRCAGAAKSAEKDGFYDNCVGQAYYAMLHCARAALLTRGITTRTHAGVRSQFGKHLVQTGEFRPELGRLLKKALEMRTTADYGPGREMNADEASRQRATADEFIEATRGYLRKRGFSDQELDDPGIAERRIFGAVPGRDAGTEGTGEPSGD